MSSLPRKSLSSFLVLSLLYIKFLLVFYLSVESSTILILAHCFLSSSLTQNSVGVYKGGRVEIIANDQGNRITPSYVAFTAEGERLIGDAAKNQLTTNPENTVFDAKRMIGRTWDDPAVQHDVKFFPFLTKKKNNKPHVQVTVKGEDRLFAAEEISAMVLTKMKVLGNECHHCILKKEGSIKFTQ